MSSSLAVDLVARVIGYLLIGYALSPIEAWYWRHRPGASPPGDNAAFTPFLWPVLLIYAAIVETRILLYDVEMRCARLRAASAAAVHRPGPCTCFRGASAGTGRATCPYCPVHGHELLAFKAARDAANSG